MNTYLVVNGLNDRPGVYAVQVTISQLQEWLEENALRYALFPGAYLYFRIFKPKKGKIVRLPNVLPNAGRGIEGRSAIVLPGALLNEQYGLYQDKVFDGAFASEEHLRQVLPPNKNTELRVMPIEVAQELFPKTESTVRGLCVAGYNNEELLPLRSYSLLRWQRLAVSIRHCFHYLGAREIHLKDITEVDIKGDFILKKLEKTAARFSADINIVHNFDIEDRVKKPIYDAEKASAAIEDLRVYPHFYETALQLKEHQQTRTFEFSETIDISFGLSLEVLASFQGVFKGGYFRDFKVTMRF